MSNITIILLTISTIIHIVNIYMSSVGVGSIFNAKHHFFKHITEIKNFPSSVLIVAEACVVAGMILIALLPDIITNAVIISSGLCHTYHAHKTAMSNGRYSKLAGCLYLLAIAACVYSYIIHNSISVCKYTISPIFCG